MLQKGLEFAALANGRPSPSRPSLTSLAGAAHLVGLSSDGKVYTWGAQDFISLSLDLHPGKCHVGQLGHGKDTDDEK